MQLIIMFKGKELDTSKYIKEWKDENYKEILFHGYFFMIDLIKYSDFCNNKYKKWKIKGKDILGNNFDYEDFDTLEESIQYIFKMIEEDLNRIKDDINLEITTINNKIASLQDIKYLLKNNLKELKDNNLI